MQEGLRTGVLNSSALHKVPRPDAICHASHPDTRSPSCVWDPLMTHKLLDEDSHESPLFALLPGGLSVMSVSPELCRGKQRK